MSTLRAVVRLNLIATLLLAVPFASPRAQDAEPEAPAASDAPAKAKPKPKPKPPAPKPAAKPAAAAAPAASHAPWPTGASMVTESYGDWTMTCTRPNDKVTCIVAQSQGDSQTGRRKFGVELQAPNDGRSEGFVLMPFGLSIEAGVTFKLDEQVLGKGAPYTMCVSDGCLVSIGFPTVALDGMRNAKKLFVTGQKASGSEPATITVPLEGFPQALDRAVALSG